ncbi:hypothetical protein A2U01_0021688, partial [Trifolium medium]|nr:hypothetical protein [Trifolium medium]
PKVRVQNGLEVMEAHTWVSISSQTNRARFIPFARNLKNFKDAYFRVRHGENGRELMYALDGSPMFPFYWTSNPSPVKVVDPSALSQFERDFVQFLELFDLIPFRDLFKEEDDDVTLKSIFRKMSRATNAQWKAHLTAARRLRAAVNQPNPATVQSANANPAIVNPVPAVEDRSAVKRGRADAEMNMEGSSLAVDKESVGASNAEVTSPKCKKTKKEKVASKGPGPVENISPVGGSTKTFIPTETSHLPLSPSVDAAEFINDHYSFNWRTRRSKIW